MLPARERSFWLARHILPHEPALRAWLRRRAVQGLEIDDIVQETYAVLAAMASVEHIGMPRAYAFQTAHSIVLRHLRRARIVRIETLADMDSLNPAADDPSPEHQASAREELRRVLALIDGLPAKCREAFGLRKIAGLSQRAVARRMGISESTVEKHIGRALRTLMDAAKDGGYPSVQASESQGSKTIRPMAEREDSRDIDDAAARWAARLDRGFLSSDEQQALERWTSGDSRRLGALARAVAVLAAFEATAEDEREAVEAHRRAARGRSRRTTPGTVSRPPTDKMGGKRP